MIKAYKKHFFILFIALVAASCNFQESARQEPPSQNPEIGTDVLPGLEAIVKAYCDFDARGKRFSWSLSEKERSYYRGMVNWKEEPKWDTVVMISGYKLSKTQKSSDVAEITVMYQVKGKYSPDETDIYEKEEKVKYRLVKAEAGWKIDVPVALPHVYPEKLIVMLEKRSEHERDAAKKMKFQNDANLIKNLKYFSFREKGLLM